MEDDIVGMLVGFIILTAIILLFIVAATVAIPATVVLGGGFISWRWYNNSPATQAKRQMNELRELYTAIGNKLRLAGQADPKSLAREALQRAEDITGTEAPEMASDVALRAAEELCALPGAGGLPVFDTATLSANDQLRSEFRQQLYAVDEAHQYGASPNAVFKEYLTQVLSIILGSVPRNVAFTEDAPLTAQLIDAFPDGRAVVENILAAAFTTEGNDAPLKALQMELDARLARIAGKPVDDLVKNPNLVPHPSKDPRAPAEVAIDYLAGTPWLSLLLSPVAFTLPDEARLEHMHVLAGSGHGKTQLLQSFIKADIDAMIAHLDDDWEGEARSVVVIDSQGDLIRNIASRAVFAPGGALADRLVLVDPTDVLHPPALNMFDVGQDRFDQLQAGDRTALYNGTIELYVYLFSELLGATMTARQGTLFRFLAQLLLAIPGANLETFLAILEDDEDCLAHVGKLDKTAQSFFATQYMGNEFKGPKKEIAWRLWSLIANPALSSMFNSPTSRIDLDAELQRGTVVLINTAKDTLKTESSRLFGRFWVAMLAQAAIKRAKVPPGQRIRAHVYLDEAHEIVDEKAEEILNQARKYKIGLTISHQNLGQLRDNATRASVAASTAIKLVGGASDKDARTYAADLRASPEQILSAKKVDKVKAEFVTFVKNHMDHGMTLSVPFGQLERLEKCTPEERKAMRAANRERYCHSPSSAPSRPAPEKTPPGNSTASRNEPAYEFKLGDPEDL